MKHIDLNSVGCFPNSEIKFPNVIEGRLSIHGVVEYKVALQLTMGKSLLDMTKLRSFGRLIPTSLVYITHWKEALVKT